MAIMIILGVLIYALVTTILYGAMTALIIQTSDNKFWGVQVWYDKNSYRHRSPKDSGDIWRYSAWLGIPFIWPLVLPLAIVAGVGYCFVYPFTKLGRISERAASWVIREISNPKENV